MRIPSSKHYRFFTNNLYLFFEAIYSRIGIFCIVLNSLKRALLCLMIARKFLILYDRVSLFASFAPNVLFPCWRYNIIASSKPIIIPSAAATENVIHASCMVATSYGRLMISFAFALKSMVQSVTGFKVA